MSLTNLRARLETNQDPEGGDERPLVRLFTPLARGVWLLSRIDPDDSDRAFGLCDEGDGHPSLGHVSLRELASRFGHLSVRWDDSFEADRPLKAYAQEAKRVGRIES